MANQVFKKGSKGFFHHFPGIREIVVLIQEFAEAGQEAVGQWFVVQIIKDIGIG
jgi:hypothetical protein